MNGYEVAAEIRKWPARPTLVAQTGWGSDEDKRKARAAGFDHHLTKPVDAANLSDLLTRLTRDRPT
ncbi:MAG TPA: hybrid sensor histidine kinase/response regulator, partial [Gemmataceae bacterium]|nr:hybrid sensor histidine kinase/response regulator [Gemmataceae bacterium]